MHPWYDFHSWSTQYREEALRQARERSLANQAGAKRFRENTLSLLRKAHLAQ
jgi:hypothetical protein